MSTKRLTEAQVSLIANALRHASELYSNDATVSHDTPRVARQFEQQAEDCDTLAELFDDAISVEVQ